MKKVIAISGGTSGLGYATAKKLSPKNKVIILSPREAKLKRAARVLKCDYELCDVTDYQSIKTAIKNILKKHKRIDVLINNAGVWIEGELGNNKPEEIKRVIDVNVTGLMLLAREVIASMKKNKKGTIINIASQAAFFRREERVVYYASKYAVDGFSKCLQAELSKYNIRVIGFYPGYMNTPLFSAYSRKRDYSLALNPKYMAEVLEYLINSKEFLQFPEVGMKHLKA
ncbi:MAG: SDR family oxidoreductase [Patescibacteria group bacterium]|nr:SDR family oxidoreductase [Patescibacteria group bacterium]